VAPAAMTRELRKVHQFNTFSIAAPLQHGIARYLGAPTTDLTGLAAYFQAKRDRFVARLQGTAWRPLPSAGTYFQLVDYGALSCEGDLPFTDRLIREAKLATIPLSPFYAAPPQMTLLRLCLAKKDETLDEAADRLAAFARRIAP
ncbi:MAG: aminotransferase class I/II-fold pyridoxal phosphate-dependent enzyme, partial [Gammaproteobacteria bacterium]|nr:aminotransferase class I/II-fold pyridoxal phosphate-dependent enzyme [Gammaproteobacteria bacterium]